MAATELGVKVLATIENLISQIDRPAHLSSIRRSYKMQSMEEGADEFDQYRVYSKMSYNFRKKDRETNKILKARVYDEEKDFQKFRVKNKTTLKILSKKNIKPIHERTNEIVAKKDIFVRFQKQQMQQLQKQSMKPLNPSTDENPNGRKYNQSDLQFYRCEIDERNKQRIKRRNLSKLNLVKRQQLQIPSVNTISRSLSSRRNVKKNYSENVFERMMQYNYELNSRKTDLREKRKREEGNFEPVLCSKSMVIAQKMRKAGINLSQSFHHHSGCQLRSANAKTITPKKFKPRQTKRQSVVNKKSSQQIDRSPNRQKEDKSASRQKISSNKCVNRTPLVQNKMNSTGSFTIKPKVVQKKQMKELKNKQNNTLSKSKHKSAARKK